MGIDSPGTAYDFGMQLSKNNDIVSIINSVIRLDCLAALILLLHTPLNIQSLYESSVERRVPMMVLAFALCRGTSQVRSRADVGRREEDAVDLWASPLRSDASLALRGERNPVRAAGGAGSP